MAGKVKVLRAVNPLDPNEDKRENFGQGIDQHIPIRFKTQVIVVAKGDKLILPKAWKGYPTDWDLSKTATKDK